MSGTLNDNLGQIIKSLNGGAFSASTLQFLFLSGAIVTSIFSFVVSSTDFLPIRRCVVFVYIHTVYMIGSVP